MMKKGREANMNRIDCMSLIMVIVLIIVVAIIMTLMYFMLIAMSHYESALCNTEVSAGQTDTLPEGMYPEADQISCSIGTVFI